MACQVELVIVTLETAHRVLSDLSGVDGVTR